MGISDISYIIGVAQDLLTETIKAVNKMKIAKTLVVFSVSFRN